MNNEITDDIVREVMANPNEARGLFLGSFEHFVRVFHYYMTREQFIFMPFHKVL